MSTQRPLLVSLIVCLAVTGGVAAQSAAPPAGPPGTVTLSLTDYNRLLDRAEHPDRVPDVPPIPSVLSRAELSIRVTGARALGTFRLDGEVFHRGPTMVPLIVDATILSAKMGDVPVPLVIDGAAAAAVVDGPTPFAIELAWGTALSSSPGRASIVIPVPTAGSASLSLDLPGRPGDMKISPGAITRTSVNGDVTHAEATLVPGARTTLSWSSREALATATPHEVRTLSDVKTLVSVGDADVRMTALVDVTIVRGEPDRLELKLPEGFAVTNASGTALATSEERPGVLVLGVQRPAERRHQFLVSLERAAAATNASLQMAVPSLINAERETGEVAVEAVGTVELGASETDVLRRMDVREANASLRALTRSPLLAALRYHRHGAEPPIVALSITRFPDAPVIAAVAERAVVTTLATAEGRTLTEVALTMRNRAQPFLRVELPEGASIVSAEVDGQTAKPAQGTGGARIPLLRPGFRPTGPYMVSFVYMQSTAPFARKGRAELTLPKMDVPVSLVEWEMFLPDRYRVKRFEGDALPLPAANGIMKTASAGVPAPSPMPVESTVRPGSGVSRGSGIAPGRIGGNAGGGGGGVHWPSARKEPATGLIIAQAGQVMGRVLDMNGSPLPGARVLLMSDGTVVNETAADATGWFLMSGVPAGRMTITASHDGFRDSSTELNLDALNARRVDFTLPAASLEEAVEVRSESESRPQFKASVDLPSAQAPSQNVFNLQRRVAGVLPVRIDVPRAGVTYRFVRPLVLDEPTRVSFDYRAK